MKQPPRRARFASGSRVVSHTLRLENDRLPPPEQLPGPRVLWSPPEGPLTLGAGRVVVVSTEGPHRFRRVRQRAKTVFDALERETPGSEAPPAARPRFYGGFGFFDDPIGSERTLVGAYFVLPRLQFVRDDGELWVTVNQSISADDAPTPSLNRVLEGLNEDGARDADPADSSGPGILSRSDRPGREDWIEGVRETLESFEASDLHKIVLAQSRILQLDRPPGLSYLVNGLCDAGSSTYRALLESPDGVIFASLSPETLVRRCGDSVTTESLAGSARIGSSARETIDRARDLMDSEKNRREHEVVLESICERLDPYVETLERRPRTVRTLSTVQHLATPIEATLGSDTHVLELVGSLHPTPAVGGVPVHRALSHIRRQEPFDRGFYGGPIGWFDERGNGDFAVGIRSALIRDRTATLYAGAGIVSDSQPEDEWEELQWKYRTFLQFLQDEASLRPS